ncbi:MAG: helix-turn-helix transcriptional regulator [Clostridiales bacterium]|nr:helix-turn-helix transcriptional regulator [Clostridiales bacterium]
MHIAIKDKLIEKGLNRNQFAKKMEIGYPAACALYDGKTTRIDFGTLESLCAVLECTPNDIFVSDNQKTQKRLSTYCNLIKEAQSKSGTEI